MENDLNPNEERFLQLLESTDFDQLTPEDQQLVLQFCEADDFRLQRRMLLQASTLHEDIPEPKALVLPQESLSFWKRPIPLYQAFSGIAATMILFVGSWFVNKNHQQNAKPGNIQQVRTDTVYRIQTIRDTIYRFKTVRYQSKTSDYRQALSQHANRQLVAVPEIYVPVPSKEVLHSSGNSMGDDPESKKLVLTSPRHSTLDGLAPDLPRK